MNIQIEVGMSLYIYLRDIQKGDVAKTAYVWKGDTAETWPPRTKTGFIRRRDLLNPPILSGDVLMDLDKQGQVLGIEVLRPSSPERVDDIKSAFREIAERYGIADLSSLLSKTLLELIQSDGDLAGLCG